MNKNLVLLCTFRAFQMSLLPLAIITIFLQVQIGLRPDQILLLQAAKSSISAIFEFPAGWIADRLGYKKTFIIGALSLIVCWSLYSFADTFTTVLIADVFLGIGWSFIYGTDSALLYESLSNLDSTPQLSKWSGRVSFWGQITEGCCALVAGILFTIDPYLPFICQAFLSIGNLLIALMLKEPPRKKSIRKDKLKGNRQFWTIPSLGDLGDVEIILEYFLSVTSNDQGASTRGRRSH